MQCSVRMFTREVDVAPVNLGVGVFDLHDDEAEGLQGLLHLDYLVGPRKKNERKKKSKF